MERVYKKRRLFDNQNANLSSLYMGIKKGYLSQTANLC